MIKLYMVPQLTCVMLLALLPVGNAVAAIYSTDFPLTENPISEGGNWINGGTVGLDWTNVAVSSGLAHGTQNGSVSYNDSTALLTGTWGSNQTVQATVHVGTRPTPGNYIEVELRLRSNLSAHSCTGYECNYSMAANGNGPYTQIVRWNGALGNFTQLASQGINQIADGTVVSAGVVGNTITTYTNGVALFSVTDATFTSGNPGMGFFSQSSGSNDSGFTGYTATDNIDPIDPPLILNPAVTNGQFGFFFLTVSGQSYTIQQFTSLTNANTGRYFHLTGMGVPYHFSLPLTNVQPSSFFRVQVP